MLPRLSSTKGVLGDPRELQFTWFSLSRHPLSWRKVKEATKLPSHLLLTFHFRPEFSFLPIMYLPPLWSWSRAVTPHGKEMWRKTFIKKRAMHGQIQGLLVFHQSYSHHLVRWSPLGNILFPVNFILRILQYFSLGCRAWHLNLGLIIENKPSEISKDDQKRIKCVYPAILFQINTGVLST